MFYLYLGIWSTIHLFWFDWNNLIEHCSTHWEGKICWHIPNKTWLPSWVETWNSQVVTDEFGLFIQICSNLDYKGLFCAIFIIEPVILIILRSSFGSISSAQMLPPTHALGFPITPQQSQYSQQQQQQSMSKLKICLQFAQNRLKICSCFVVVDKTFKVWIL